MDLQGFIDYLLSFLTFGSLVIIDLIAASTSALNTAFLVQRPDYYSGRQWSVIGILLLSVIGGLGGGVVRDVLLNRVPEALTNPWYITLCFIAGGIGLFTAYRRLGHKFREAPFQLMTAFSLPWYAIVGVGAGIEAGLPDIACLAIGVIGPTTGRFVIDIAANKSAKNFIRGEWFSGSAMLTSIVYLISNKHIGLDIYPATLIAVIVGFSFRVAALWYAWEEPLPNVPPEVMGEVVRRQSLKEKMQPGWRANYDKRPLRK
jgi:uncharacterized membrane protein YeiH